jgi:CubicO group peptidase (beta-lactamase class C family)
MNIHRRHLMTAASAGLVLSRAGSPALAKALPDTAPASAGFDAARLKRIDIAMKRLIDAGQAPGFITAIVRDARIVHFETHGQRNLAGQAPMTRDTIFRLMSMTKPIVSVAAMMLVEEGRMRLSDPVARFIPAFAKSKVYVNRNGEDLETTPARRQIQVRNLLMHTSGYTYGFGRRSGQRKNVFANDFPSLAAFAAAAADVPLQFEPGTQWEYGISTDILGHVVELAAGKPLPEVLQERIIGPLGMTDTAFHVPADKAARFATTYRAKDGKLEVFDDAATSPFLKPPAAPSGGGGLVGTADDYLRFAAMLLNEGELDGVRILGPQTVRLMRANHLPSGLSTYGDAKFGLGFGVDVDAASRNYYGGPGTYHWSGANRTFFWVDPVNRVVGLLMTQLEPFNTAFEEEYRALVYQALMN